MSKHEKELEDFKNDFEEKWKHKNPGYTRAILNKLRSRDSLWKTKNYKEAQVIQDEIEDLKDEHFNNWNTTIKQKSYDEELKNLKKRQSMELNVLKEKLKIFQEKFEVKMKNEDKKIKTKYNAREKALLNEFKRKKDAYFKYNH